MVREFPTLQDYTCWLYYSSTHLELPAYLSLCLSVCMCVLLQNISCVHLSRAFFRPCTSIGQCLCYLSNIIMHAAKMCNIMIPVFSLSDPFKKFLCGLVSEHSPLSKLKVLSAVTVKMERVSFTETSVNYYQTTCRHIPELICVCIYVYITYISADLRYFRVQRKSKFIIVL
jgi:hypothetical protein